MAETIRHAPDVVCPTCGGDLARMRFDRLQERIAITCHHCGRTDIRLFASWSDAMDRHLDLVDPTFLEPS